jgi:hypothetical protein
LTGGSLFFGDRLLDRLLDDDDLEEYDDREEDLEPAALSQSSTAWLTQTTRHAPDRLLLDRLRDLERRPACFALVASMVEREKGVQNLDVRTDCLFTS